MGESNWNLQQNLTKELELRNHLSGKEEEGYRGMVLTTAAFEALP